jgi:hypothetical protein
MFFICSRLVTTLFEYDWPQSIVPHLVCKGNMVVPYLDFRKFSEPALTQDQV